MTSTMIADNILLFQKVRWSLRFSVSHFILNFKEIIIQVRHVNFSWILGVNIGPLGFQVTSDLLQFVQLSPQLTDLFVYISSEITED